MIKLEKLTQNDEGKICFANEKQVDPDWLSPTGKMRIMTVPTMTDIEKVIISLEERLPHYIPENGLC